MLRLWAVRVQAAAAARAAADAYIAEKVAEFGIDLTEVNGSASSSAAVAETAVAETESAVEETAETESAVVAVVAKTAVAAVVASTSAPTSATAGLSKRWRNVVQGRARPVVRPLAAVQNTQSLHFLLRVASARSARVNAPGFMTAVFARQAQLNVGKSRGAMIAANGPAAAKRGRAHRPGGGRTSTLPQPQPTRSQRTRRYRRRRRAPRLHGLARTRQRRGKEDGGHEAFPRIDRRFPVSTTGSPPHHRQNRLSRTWALCGGIGSGFPVPLACQRAAAAERGRAVV